MKRSIPAYAQPAFVEYVSAHAARGDADAARLLARCAKSAAPPKPKAPGLTKEERDAKWSAFVAWVRAAVWSLSDHSCEHCGRVLPTPLGEMDHSRGGSYRSEFTLIEWCRRLCHQCHTLRTANLLPDGTLDAAYWLDHMEAVRVRRLETHGADKVFGLLEEQAKRLEEADPKLARNYAGGGR